jgi:hypothetical protein
MSGGGAGDADKQIASWMMKDNLKFQRLQNHQQMS